MKNIVLLFLMMVSVATYAQTVRVVNMIPNALSNETNQDSEPHLTVNPNDPLEFVGSAFTPNPTGATATAPIYFTQDGGTTWLLNNIVPSGNGMTGDITVGLSKNNVLYAGILRGGSFLQMRTLRSNNYTALPGVAMTNLVSRSQDDQPYVEVITPLGGAGRNNDHVYVGHNEIGAPGGQTASIEQSLNAATAPAPANFTTQRLEVRTTAGQDGPPIRTSVHPNGTVYTIIDRLTNIPSGSFPITVTSDVVVLRDDNWGQNGYGDLVDPSDGLAGRIVVSGLTWTFDSGNTPMGQARIGDRFSIAVDPRNDQTVYIAYIDRPTATINSNRLNVLRSTDGGATWSAALLTAANVTVPQLAVNTLGQVGLLYQQLTGPAGNQQWVTHFRQSNNGGGLWNDIILHQAPSNVPAAVFAPYLGDYAGLLAFGKDFYGAFSGNNTPDMTNFPNGVTYQRNANFTTNTLRNVTNTSNVAVSIDPFFFSITQIADAEDFYMRDWTDSAASNDIGLEPSTDPVFFNTSDIWNRRTNNPGGFSGNDRPQNQNAQLSAAGNNFMFARVHRKGTGTARNVNLHFLKSEFGTGSNYVNANTTADPTLNFAAGELVKTMTAGYEWTLNATTSSHICIAVEISTPNDPLVAPTLIGRAPGWPDTDLSVLYDNNKAQRNIGAHALGSTTFGGSAGTITYYAVLHNASFQYRDMELTVNSPNPKLKFDVISPNKENLRWVTKSTVKAVNMKPGENRWIGIQVRADESLSPDEHNFIDITEVVNNIPVNGFTIAVKQGTPKEVFNEVIDLQLNSFFRVAKLYDSRTAATIYRQLLDMKSSGYKAATYRSFIKKTINSFQETVASLIERNKGKDTFTLKKTITELKAQIGQEGEGELLNVHSKFAQALDAFITFLDKQQGDVADIIQNIRWQLELFAGEKLANLPNVRTLEKLSNAYIKAYTTNKISERAYSAYSSKIVTILKDTASYLGDEKLNRLAEMMNQHINNPQRLQKAHYEFLLRLASIL
jgi:hypothetical protein